MEVIVVYNIIKHQEVEEKVEIKDASFLSIIAIPML